MSIFTKVILISLLSISLIACDGFELDSDTSTSAPEKTFTRTELAFNVLFSSTVLNDSGFSNRDGYILLFKSSAEVQQIALRNDNEDDTLVGDYAWEIVNDDLQITYPNGVTCTSSKNSETGLELTASTTCSGGEPNNDRIANTLNSPVSFVDDNMSASTIIIENGDDDQSIEFYDNSLYEIRNLDSSGDEINVIVESGTYSSEISTAGYNKVIRLDKDEADEYTLLVLLEGNLSSGTMLQLRYQTTDFENVISDTLKEIRIYDIDQNGLWNVESLYEDINIDP